MGIIDAFPFTLGSFAILDDLDDSSSGTDTYVERRHATKVQDKSKSKSKQSTTTATRAHAHERTGKHAVSGTVKGPETARSTTVANVTMKEEHTRLRDTNTNVSAKRSVANETTTKRSTITAPAALGRESSRRSRQDRHDEERERRKSMSKKGEDKRESKMDETNIEVITNSKDTIRSISMSQAKSRGTSQAPLPSEAETKADVSIHELRKENRTLHRRTERLEKDLVAYRRHAEHYRERRREADRERLKAEERVRELETVVTNMRESYELELQDLRTQITEYAAKAAAVTSAAQVYANDLTGETGETRGNTPSRRGAESKPPSVRKAPSMHDFSVQTDALLVQAPPPRPITPFPAALPATSEASLRVSTLMMQLEHQDAELRALKLFHDETPQILLDVLASSVKALNVEIRTLATAMANGVPLGRSWQVAQAWALEAADPPLAHCLRLLSDITGADFTQDITLVRLALQAWIVSCLQRVFEKFLFGLEKAEDEMLRRVFERVQSREPPPVAARWRALARRNARTLAIPPTSTPGTSGGFPAARDHAIHLLEMDILVGCEAILRFAGAHSPPGVLLSDLSTSHGRRINRLVRHAAKLASNLAERGPVGCEVFTVHVGEEGEHGQGEADGGGMVLCGCMESVDQECRQWVGQTARTERGGRTTGTRTRTHTRAGTVRNKSKTRSHAWTATTRTYADTNIRQWDRDDTEEEDSEEEDEEIDDEEEPEDQFVENVDVQADEAGQPAVLCSLSFGLRRVLRRARRRNAHSRNVADDGPGDRPRAQRSEETLQRERRRVPKPEVETLHDTSSDAKSTYTITSITATSPLSSRTERQRQASGHHGEGREGGDEDDGDEGRAVEVLVKTDVLISSTVDSLRRRVVR